MKFSQTTTLDGLVQDITFITGLDTNAVNTKERARLMNRWYYKAAILAWKSDPDWQFDDGVNIAAGQTDGSWTYDATFAGLPRATRTLTDNVRVYALPTKVLAIERVEILRSDGNWFVIDPIRESDIPRITSPEGVSNYAVSEFYKTKGIPRYYNLVGSNIELFPAPDSTQVTLTAGLKVYVTREMYEFVSTDSSAEPALPEPFHRILSLGASYDIALAKGMEKAKALKQEVEQLLMEMQGYYVNRTRYNNRGIRPPKKSFI